MDDFTDVIKKDSEVQIKIKDMLDKYEILPFNYLSIKGSDTLIQNVILEGTIKLMASTIVDVDIELEMKIS